MRFELLLDWPHGQHCIPRGTVIDGSDPQWLGIPLRLPMPREVLALDQDAADALSRWYPWDLHLLRAGPGVTIRKLINV